MENLNLLIVFIEGIVSFFSPCILPILPIYLSILSSSDISDLKKDKYYNNSLILNTITFVLGISTTFFILGLSINSLASLIDEYRYMVMMVGGITIIIMGLFYIDILKINILQREKRFKLKVDNMSMAKAYLLGFTFSFSWTPCIGPMLTSVIIMSTNSDSIMSSILLIGVYTFGFTIPFLIVSIFYNKLYKAIDKIKKHTPKIKEVGGMLLLITGIIMTMNGYKQYQIKENQQSIQNEQSINIADFELYDQYGQLHSLDQYKDKVIFLNFWATWCPPCKMEMPYIQEIYEEYGYNKSDVIILGVAMPNMGKEGSKEDITEFLKENEYTFPTIFDEGFSLMYKYNISSFPSTFIINKDGEIDNFVPGALSKENMKYLISESK